MTAFDGRSSCLIHPSKFESEFFNLRVFRSADSTMPEAQELRSACIEHEVDLLRLKIDVKYEENINYILHETQFPFFYSHSVMTVYANYSNAELHQFKNTDLIFTKFTGGENNQRFSNLVQQGMADNPIGYFKTPIINRWITKEKEAQCYAAYYSILYDGNDPNKLAFLMSKGKDDVGVFVFELEGTDTIHTSMAAVLPEFRNSGLFHDMKVFRQQFCIENGITHAYAGFRLNNFYTPNSLLRIGYKIVRAEHVFHLPLLLQMPH